MKIALFALILLFLPAATTALAADMYQVNSGATVQINEHGVCQRITNSHASGRPIMVPTRTATEWTTFRNNRPAGVAMVACPPACSGVSVGGYCWYASGAGQSCNQACSSHGGVNMAGTRDYAGSGGTLDGCKSVAQALWGTTANNQSEDSSGINRIGCAILAFFPILATRMHFASTTADSSSSAYYRACACNN